MQADSNHSIAWQILQRYELAAQQLNSGRLQNQSDAIRCLHCVLGSHDILIPQSELVEVMATPMCTTVPGGPAWLIGLANRFGQMLPVIDTFGWLSNSLFKEPAKQTVVVGDDEMTIGLAVQKIVDPVTVSPPSSLPESNSNLPDKLKDYIQGYSELAGKPVPVLAVTEMLDAINRWQS